MAAAVVLACMLAGFAAFVFHVNSASVPAAAKADAIVVLTGGRSRLDPAVDLLLDGHGQRLLVSGVNGDVTRESLRKALGLDPAPFECCVDIDRAALDTKGNAEATAIWVQANGFGSLIVVTNDYHMPRALAEFRRAMPGVELVAWPVINGYTDASDPLKRIDRYRVLAGEYIKYGLARIRNALDGSNSLVQRAGIASGW